MSTGPIGHSGNLPPGMGKEVPIKEQPIPLADEPSLSTPESPEGLFKKDRPRRTFSRKQVAWGGGILGVTLLTGIGAGTALANRGSDELATDTTNSAGPLTPDQTPAQPTPAESVAPVEAPANTEVPAVIENYLSIPAVEFNQKNPDEQLILVSWLTERSLENPANYPLGTELNPLKTASVEDGGQTIVDNALILKQNAYNQFEFIGGIGEETVILDKETAEKALSGVFYNTPNAKTDTYVLSQYRNEVDRIATTEGLVDISKADSDIITVTNTSKKIEGIDMFGDAITYKILKIYDGLGNGATQQWVFHEFTNGQGEREAAWLLSQNVALDQEPSTYQ